MKIILSCVAASVLVATVIACGGGGASSAAVAAAPATANGVFLLSSSVAGETGSLPVDYTCDGTSASPPLAWANAPIGTKEFVLLMTTIPSDGTVKYNWVLSGIPATATSLERNTTGVGVGGVGSDGPVKGYQAPCSQGPGSKVYSFTLYALSASPVLGVAADAVTGSMLSSAISAITLSSSTLNVSYARGSTSTTPTATLGANCTLIHESLKASTTGVATSTCDSTYAYVASNGLATHPMMDGITATNLQVPLAVDFSGTNAWKIPLTPTIAAVTTSAVDGPIGVAINGVPIFNPCKQGGCQNGDTKLQGELDSCNGHAGRGDDYHYHAAPTCMMAGQAASYWNTHPVGWALDGFAIYGYNNADGTPATRDGVCGGNTSAVVNGPAGYSYHVTDASPYVLSCFRGTPSTAARGQPLRQPPVTPFPVTNMTLTSATDGYQVLQFTSNQSFTTTATGTDSYSNAAGSYIIRYKAVVGTELSALLTANPGKTACWSFQFKTSVDVQTQPPMSYCK
jgi:phosphatidylethanolamine-binding protein (PEBP) family uncharacterized protein